MIGVIVNTVAVVLGGSIGLLVKKAIPQGWADFILKGLALCVIYIGIDGALSGENPLISILSMAIGSVIGLSLDLDKKLKKFSERLETKWQKTQETTSIAEGFFASSLLFCVGALTIVGSLQAGLTGDCDMLYTKSALDFVSAIVFAASLGAGVLLAAFFVLFFQGSIVLLAQIAEPFLNAVVIDEMTCVGSLLIFALGLNMLEITNLKVMNYLPAIFLPILLCLFL